MHAQDFIRRQYTGIRIFRSHRVESHPHVFQRVSPIRTRLPIDAHPDAKTRFQIERDVRGARCQSPIGEWIPRHRRPCRDDITQDPRIHVNEVPHDDSFGDKTGIFHPAKPGALFELFRSGFQEVNLISDLKVGSQRRFRDRGLSGIAKSRRAVNHGGEHLVTRVFLLDPFQKGRHLRHPFFDRRDLPPATEILAMHEPDTRFHFATQLSPRKRRIAPPSIVKVVSGRDSVPHMVERALQGEPVKILRRRILSALQIKRIDPTHERLVSSQATPRALPQMTVSGNESR